MTTQVNSTVLGTLGNLTVTGNVNIASNISASRYTGGSVNVTDFINTSANVSGAVVNAGALNVTGTLTTSGVANGPGMNSVNYLSANVAITSTSTSGVDVDGLLVTTEANKFYRFEAYIPHNVSTNLTRRFGIKYTAGHTAYYTVETSATTLTSTVEADGSNANAAPLSSSQSDPAGRNFLLCRITGCITGSTAGHVQIIASVSTGTLTLLQGSQIILTKLN